MERIGIRELRQYASEFLRRVAKGESFEVTDRGRPVARLVPVDNDSTWSRLVASGRIKEAQRSFKDLPPPLKPRKGKPLPSEILARLREDER